MAYGGGAVPLLGTGLEAPSAPPLGEMADLAPSAPSFPAIFSEQELEALVRQLSPGPADASTPAAALRTFRACTAGRLLWTAQMRLLASRTLGGAQLMREAYERRLLLDPESLTAADGEWVALAAAASAPPSAQAFLSSLTVVRFDGRVAHISADFSATSLLEVLRMAAIQLGDPPFDPTVHQAFGVGLPRGASLGVGQYVRITGLVQEERLNGLIGPVLEAQADSVEVALPGGPRRLHCDNVVPFETRTVVRNPAFHMDVRRTLADFGLAPDARLLWLEDPFARPPSPQKQPQQLGGALAAIKAQFAAMGAAGSSFSVSVGEMRNFLWNLHLNDEDWAKVKERFAPGAANYISLEEMLFLLGRPHLQAPDVPVDALIYEAVVSIIGRRCTAHIDRDLGQQDAGVGCGPACREHCASYTTSLLLQGIVAFNLSVLLLSDMVVGVFRLDSGTTSALAYSAAGAYIIYLCHLLCCVGLTRAFANTTTGMEQVLELMDKPRHEHPVFHWRVQCYHYVTRTHTSTDSEGRTKTETRTERVNTHFASHSGVIPSTDLTPSFVPSTQAPQTQIDTLLDLDFSQSNYISEYHRFCAFNRWDVHQDCSRSEELPSRATSCLAVWSERGLPWWMNGFCYWLANIFLLSFFYRLAAQSHMGHQQYTYVKKCYCIQTGLYGVPAVGAAVAVAAVAGGAAAVGLVGAGLAAAMLS